MRGGRKREISLCRVPRLMGVGKSPCGFGNRFLSMWGSPCGFGRDDTSMTSYNPGTVGGGTYQEMCGINYFWKEAFWPWLITWSRAGRQTGRGFPGMLPPPVAAEILCHPPSQEDGALVRVPFPKATGRPLHPWTAISHLDTSCCLPAGDAEFGMNGPSPVR